MKKFFTLGVLTFGVIAGMNAQSMHILDQGEVVGGIMPLCLSPNGTYLGGSTYSMAAFESEWAINKTVYLRPDMGSNFMDYGAEIRSITDDGLGVGFDDNGAIMLDFTTKKYTVYQPLDSKNKIYDAIADDITADGSIICGCITSSGYTSHAVLWKDGEVIYLDEPTPGQIGCPLDGTRAMAISRDGSLIVGYTVDPMSTNPMITWTLQDDGSYKLNPVCSKYYGSTNSDKPWGRFQPMSISPDATKVVVSLQANPKNSEEATPILLGIYDVINDELTVVNVDGEHGVSKSDRLLSFNHGISNNGTAVGWLENELGQRLPWIMFADEMQPTLLSIAYPELEMLAAYDEMGEHAVSSISQDGRYLAGMGVEDSVKYGQVIYQGYVIDLEGESGKTTWGSQGDPDDNRPGGEGAVETLDAEALGASEIFTIDGLRHSAPVKGLNIIRTADGKIRKSMIRE